MKNSMYKRFAKVNTTFIKYNILAGIENLGVADCNKYYVSFCEKVPIVMTTYFSHFQVQLLKLVVKSVITVIFT